MDLPDSPHDIRARVDCMRCGKKLRHAHRWTSYCWHGRCGPVFGGNNDRGLLCAAEEASVVYRAIEFDVWDFFGHWTDSGRCADG